MSEPFDPAEPTVGVGPWEGPWPTDERFDPELLRDGDQRNVVDKYRYQTMDAIRADLAATTLGLHIAIQNWEHDFNIGSIVRTANAFNVERVHILGRRRWNRRGAMVTNRYLDVVHHEHVGDFFAQLDQDGIVPIGVDNLDGSVPLEHAVLPRKCCLIFGSEGPGLTEEVVLGTRSLVAITQYGSTRSINAGAAAAIAMYHWTLTHAHGVNPSTMTP